jgi:hypothetical protein
MSEKKSLAAKKNFSQPQLSGWLGGLLANLSGRLTRKKKRMIE